MGDHGSSGKSHRHGSKEHRKHKHRQAPIAQATPSGYGQWPPPDYYGNGKSRGRKGGFGRKLIKLVIFLLIIGVAIGGGWYGMQMLSGNAAKDSVAKKKKKDKAPDGEVAKNDEEAKVEPKAEPKAEPKKEPPKEETKVTPEPKTEPKTKPPEPKTEPKDMPKVDGPLVYFDKQILPIMQKHCIRCHGEGNKKFEGKFDTRTVAAIMKGGENGKSVVPGNPEKSAFWEDNVKPGTMPPKGEGKLTDEEKKLIYDWIKGGCKDTAAVAAN